MDKIYNILLHVTGLILAVILFVYCVQFHSGIVNFLFAYGIFFFSKRLVSVIMYKEEEEKCEEK